MVDDLPLLWSKVARANKAQTTAIIQQVMEAASLEITEKEWAFQVMTGLAIKITSPLSWRPINLDDLTSGLTPFLLMPHAPSERHQQQWQIELASMVYKGTTTTLSDAVHLMTSNEAPVPLDCLQSKSALQNFAVLFHGLLGQDHPLVGELMHLLQQFKNNKDNLSHMRPPPFVSHYNLPTLVLRWVHMCIAGWLQRQHKTPNFAQVAQLSKLFNRMKVQDASWIPSCHHAYSHQFS